VTERIRTTDGRILLVDPQSGTYDLTYFTGTYEPGITRVLSTLTRRGDVCFDVGANIGWHTTLLAAHSGGSVHAFEPVPASFNRLRENLALNGWRDKVRASRMALGDVIGSVEVHVFRDLPEGHASISPMGRVDFDRVTAPISTLDAYLAEQDPGQVDILKADVEGAELALLRGAGRLFAQFRPPLMVFEMARATLAPFGHEPNDLLDFIERAHPYDFFVIDDRLGHCRPFRRFPEGHIGANVLCVPAGCFADRTAALRLAKR
jgi:FkbM family methyltransferase